MISSRIWALEYIMPASCFIFVCNLLLFIQNFQSGLKYLQVKSPKTCVARLLAAFWGWQQRKTSPPKNLKGITTGQCITLKYVYVYKMLQQLNPCFSEPLSYLWMDTHTHAHTALFGLGEKKNSSVAVVPLFKKKKKRKSCLQCIFQSAAFINARYFLTLI